MAIIRLLKDIKIESNIFYNKYIEKNNSILIKKADIQSASVIKIRELVEIYEKFYKNENLTIEVIDNEDILITKLTPN
ncbi:hypothetical protein [Malaciobacter canalis]|uniref:hypothetical protein n=1 Tax=Malaciobacter canalis TaxID=1912871 RepID=UPI00384F8B0B